jgi:hypothetical protein
MHSTTLKKSKHNKKKSGGMGDQTARTFQMERTVLTESGFQLCSVLLDVTKHVSRMKRGCVVLGFYLECFCKEFIHVGSLISLKLDNFSQFRMSDNSTVACEILIEALVENLVS